MENEEQKIGEYVRRIVMPKLMKVAEETTNNRVLVGSAQKTTTPYVLYQPHNYRLYIDFNKATFNQPNQPQKLGCYQSKVVNFKESFMAFPNFSVRVKKNQIQINNQIENDRWYIINLDNTVEEQIYSLLSLKDKQVLDFLKEFIQGYGGESSFKIIRRVMESKVKGEDIIDKIPLETTFHNEVGKKVYKEKSFEWYNEAHFSNYIVNASIRKVSPEIADELQNIKDNFKGFMENLKLQSENINYLAKNINTHIPVLKKLGVEAGRIADSVDDLKEEIKKRKKKKRQVPEYIG